jgi:ribose transport system ATP-binding protein
MTTSTTTTTNMTITSSQPVLHMEGITKSFAGVPVLKGINFSVARGEVHGLLGENGAGKSTFLKIMSGAYHKDAGTISVDSTSVELRDPGHARDLGIALIHQELSLLPHLSIAENIFLGRLPRRRGAPWLIDWNAARARSVELLEPLGLKVDPRRPVSTLKVADQQLVEIAKALSINAKVVAMDEPTATLSDAEIAHLFEQIRSLTAAGVAVIYVSHRLVEVGQICDRATVMRDGQVVATVDARTTDSRALARLMVGRELSHMYPKTETERGSVTLKVSHLTTDKLKDVSLTAYQGEILGIGGLVGAGRTELARAIFGADPIVSGSVEVNGTPLALSGPRDAIRRGIGLVPEDRKAQGAVLGMSVAQNITMASLSDISRGGQLRLQREKQVATKYIRELHIAARSQEQEVRRLSGGNQQKVVLAKWLASRSKILIIDEPTRGVDVGAKAAIHSLLNDLASQGATIVMISSELPELIGMSDRVLVMHEGRITGELQRSELSEEAVMLYATGHAA